MVGVLFVLVVAVLFIVGLMRAIDRQDEYAARQCPTSYTPTLTRDGCVCLMKAK